MKLVWGSSITKLWKIEQEGRARQAPQRPEETSSQPTWWVGRAAQQSTTQLYLQARQPHHHRRQPRDRLREVKYNNHTATRTSSRGTSKGTEEWAYNKEKERKKQSQRSTRFLLLIPTPKKSWEWEHTKSKTNEYSKLCTGNRDLSLERSRRGMRSLKTSTLLKVGTSPTNITEGKWEAELPTLREETKNGPKKVKVPVQKARVEGCHVWS